MRNDGRSEPDSLRAQKILRRAMLKMVKECGMRHDWSTFIAVTMVCVSATIVEAASSDDVMKEGGGALVDHCVGVFKGILEDDVKGRLAHEMAQVRH